ncbi:peptidase domain-containing ABC transporter [Novispirillum itersonii]|uniref:peptidase domain-containing ABC transporter n=1 Tax=Novispirillum itersonii TaxID=189 RepID=UPI00036BAFAF|nr:ABC transporter transmembrane domain-containing protein [Novispirillum itersonii]
MIGLSRSFQAAQSPKDLVAGHRHLAELVSASLVINLVALALPLSMLQVYDRILPNHNTATLDMLTLGVLTAIVLEALLRTVREGIAGLVSARFEHRGHYETLRRLLSLPLSGFERDGGGTHLERLSAIDRLRDQFGGRTLLALVDAPFVVIYLSVIMFLGGWLVLAPIVASAIFIGVSIWQGQQLRGATEQTGEQDERRFNFMLETLSGIQTVKALSAEVQMLRRFERLLEGALGGRRGLAIRQGNGQITGAIYMQALTVLTVAFGALMVVDHAMTVGSLGACTMLAGRIAPPIQAAIGVWLRRQSVHTAIQRVEETFSMPVNISMKPLEVTEGVLTLENVSHGKRPDGTFVVQDVNLTLRPGESISIRGENGSGKSLLLWLMTGQVRPDKGRVLIDGQDLSSLDPQSVAALIGVLPEQGEVFTGTLMENLTLFDAEREQDALKVADELGLNEVAASLAQGFDAPLGGRIGSSLPRGVIQRIAIGRVLTADPLLLLFDDANALLDGASDQRLTEAIERRMPTCGVVIVSHRPSTLRIATTHYEIRDGRLQLLENPMAPVPVKPPAAPKAALPPVAPGPAAAETGPQPGSGSQGGM